MCSARLPSLAGFRAILDSPRRKRLYLLLLLADHRTLLFRELEKSLRGIRVDLLVPAGENEQCSACSAADLLIVWLAGFAEALRSVEAATRVPAFRTAATVLPRAIPAGRRRCRRKLRPPRRSGTTEPASGSLPQRLAHSEALSRGRSESTVGCRSDRAGP
jgi:hypothetical protein